MVERKWHDRAMQGLSKLSAKDLESQGFTEEEIVELTSLKNEKQVKLKEFKDELREVRMKQRNENKGLSFLGEKVRLDFCLITRLILGFMILSASLAIIYIVAMSLSE